MKITLIRHTRVAVPAGVCYGVTDVDVAPTFEQEATVVRDGLRGLSFDVVYTSPLQRCWKLARFCGFPEAVADERLRELNFGTWEGQRWEAIRDPHLQEWYDNWLNQRAGGAESFLDHYNRVADFLDELRGQAHRHVCLFTHGGTIRAACIHVGLFTFNRAFSHEVDYGSRITITF